jgi:CheY-like chemotaxis protein
MEQIFRPFFSTRKHAGGTGLGLATVATVVAQSGGSISVSSALHEGSTFKVQWPLADSLRRAQADERVANGPLKGLRILVVDDQPDIVRILRRLLKREHCEVITATSVKHGKDRMRTSGPFDVILSDVVLDDGQGTDLYAFAQAEQFAGHFVFMSGFGGTTIADVIGTTDYYFLRKPFVPRDVRKVLAQATGRS